MYGTNNVDTNMSAFDGQSHCTSYYPACQQLVRLSDYQARQLYRRITELTLSAGLVLELAQGQEDLLFFS